MKKQEIIAKRNQPLYDEISMTAGRRKGEIDHVCEGYTKAAWQKEK